MLVRCDVQMVGTSQLVCSKRCGVEIWGLTGKPSCNSFNKSGVFLVLSLWIVASNRRCLWPRDGPIKRGRQPWEARSSSDGRRWDDDLFVPSCQSATGVIMLAYCDSWGPSGGQPRAECEVRKRRRASRQNKGSCKSSWDANTDWLLKAKP